MNEGNADEDGYAFIADYTGTANAIDLAFYAKGRNEYYDDQHEEMDIIIAIYEGQGFSNLMVKQTFTAAYEYYSGVTLSTFTFDEEFSLIHGEWYTIGFSLGMRFGVVMFCNI